MQFKTIKSIGFVLVSLFSVVFASSSYAEDVINPILLDKEALSGLGLDAITSNSKDQELFSKTIFEGKKFDVKIGAGTPTKVEVNNFPSDQFIYMMNGTATLTEKNGSVHHFKTGDFFVVPKGFSGEWYRQGNRYYQELVVVMKQRSGEAIADNISPYLVDKDKFSGLGLSKTSWSTMPDVEFYSDHVFQGSELGIAIVSAATNTAAFNSPMSEEFVYVINGSATLTATGGKPHTFYTGDFFVVPEGFVGTWTANGNHLYRELIAVPTH